MVLASIELLQMSKFIMDINIKVNEFSAIF